LSRTEKRIDGCLEYCKLVRSWLSRVASALKQHFGLDSLGPEDFDRLDVEVEDGELSGDDA